MFLQLLFYFSSLKIFTGPPNLTISTETHEKTKQNTQKKRNRKWQKRQQGQKRDTWKGEQIASQQPDVPLLCGTSVVKLKTQRMMQRECWWRDKKGQKEDGKTFHIIPCLFRYLLKNMFVCYFWPAQDASLFNRYNISRIELLAEKHWSILSMTCDKCVYSASVNLDQ